METLQHAVLSNVGWAAVLALVAAIASRMFRQRSAMAHSLWLLVLLKLVTPSPLQLPPMHFSPDRGAGPATIEPIPARLPAEPPMGAEVSEPTVVGASAVPPAVVATRPASPRVSSRDRDGAEHWPWRTTALVLWLTGAGAWWSLVIAQVSRFRRLLLAARPAPEALRDRTGRLAIQLGLHPAPAVWLVPARVPPMLWALAGPPRLLLPEELWGRLDETQQDTVLVHELAHLKRRDHWVRWLEAVVLGLYWWDPIAWWARRQVEKAEEQCCDAWVVWALPEAAEAYAEALVTTAVFLSGPRIARPPGATGVGSVPPLRRRLSMILRDPAAGLMARPAPRGALIVGALALFLLPAWATSHPPAAARSGSDARADRATPSGAGSEGGAGQVPAPIREVPSGPRPERLVAALSGSQRVAVSQPLVREVRDYAEFTGRVEAAQTIEIRARISGTLIKVHPQTEPVTEKGSLLFEIDPRPFQAERDLAEADLRRAEGQVKRRSAELQRARQLVAKGAMTQDEFGRIEGESEEAEASLQKAKATLDIARLKLDATRVTAPIRGRVGRRQVAEGSLVVADSTVLATIDSVDPMMVAFHVDERTILKLGRERREGNAKSAPGVEFPRILVGLADEDGFPRRGQFDSADTRFDPASGTLLCRAVVPNPDGLLLPGLFARVRVVTGAPTKALLVSLEAPTINQQGAYVFVVNDRDEVERRAVRLGQAHDGLRVVKEGLKEGEWVVVEGVDVVKPGLTIKAERVAMPTRPSAPRDASER